MIDILVIGIGGFIGSVSRYLLSIKVQQLFSGTMFPFGTMFVNISGCLIIGFISGFSENVVLLSPRIRFFLIAGVLGGYTTFSTFGNETFNLIREDEFILALINVGIQVIMGVIAVWLGYVLSKICSSIV